MPEFSNAVVSLFQRREASQQGGLLSGNDPTEFNANDPIRLWIVQLGIIVCTASLLSLGLSKLRQPKVIAEVLGGIILGPTAFGRIPGFTEHIFPMESRSYLSLVANIGLCLFLFLVGLEIDSNVIKRNLRLSATIALAGMVVPFGIGAGVAAAIYREFVDPSIEFTHFMLFTGVAFSITAFPVLCRILTELKLLDTTVGIVVLSAGVGNDIVGWVLLALSVALVNASTGLTALYILLTCVGWTIFMLFPVKWAVRWLARKTGSIESGPTVFFMTAVMMILFGSAFFTDIIGVHAIFGAFIAGLIVPRAGGLAIAMTEKLEDMVSVIFLPLYFTLSGLSTDLGLLDNGITWAYTIAIIFTAFIGKFGACAIAARYAAGFNWREATTIGSLMSCKGLVELIVLNVGLSAGILSKRVFSMFVLEALVLTFMTTPLVTWLYPPHMRKRVDATGPTFNNVADGEATTHKRHVKSISTTPDDYMTRFTVVLDKLEHLPGMMFLTQLIQPPSPTLEERPAPVTREGRASTSRSREDRSYAPVVSTQALRLLELSDRVSAVMKSSNTEALAQTDPLLSIYRMYGQLNGIKVNPAISFVKFDELAWNVAERAEEYEADLILLPWLPPHHDAYSPDVTQHPPASAGVAQGSGTAPPTPAVKVHVNNPFDLLFRTGGQSSTPAHGSDHGNPVSIIHSQFVRGVFSQARTDVALFVDRSMLGRPEPSGFSTVGQQQHLFLPFFGGPDDRLALGFLMRICKNRAIRATVVWITKIEGTEEPGVDGEMLQIPHGLVSAKNAEEINALTVSSRIAGMPDTVYGQADTETHLQSRTADEIEWTKFESVADLETPNVEFSKASSQVPLRCAIDHAQRIYASQTATGRNVVIVTGRSRRLAPENHREELRQLMNEHYNAQEHVGAEVRKTVGDVATAFVVAGVGEAVVVLQQAGL